MVYPVGYRNRFGHPRADVVARYGDARIWRTDRHGAITFELGGDVLRFAWREAHPATGTAADAVRAGLFVSSSGASSMSLFSRLFGQSAAVPSRVCARCSAPAAGLHRMRYTEWGDPSNPRVLVCVHGLTRNGRDFDALAAAMSAHYRVVCPDIAGRGRSDWLADPAGYGIPQYVADMMVLLARLDVPAVHWFGTSMGGLIGMAIASQKNSPISRLVLNDVGPLITAESLRRIGEYVGKARISPTTLPPSSTSASSALRSDR